MRLVRHKHGTSELVGHAPGSESRGTVREDKKEKKYLGAEFETFRH
jgi:hypothetical protein